MSFVATAIIGAGALGAGATIYGANKAASAQTNAANAAISAQRDMFNTAKGEVQPFVDMGTSAIPTLQSLVNPGTASETLAKLPGFQFQQQYGTKAATNALAARGLGASAGPISTAIGGYVTGLAGTTWQNAVQALQGLVNTGANSANTIAGNAVQTGQGIAGSTIGAGNAQAGANMATAGAIGNAAGAIPNALLWNQIMSKMGGAPGGTGIYNRVDGYGTPVYGSGG